LFSPDPPPAAARGDDVRVLSAPGEGREAIEIARRVLGEARRGVRFDEMAVLVRGREYVGLLEHAFARAGIPAYFEHGTRRPHPAGRALLALLACADEDLSARRFSEYLSLAQVPAAVRPPGSRKEAGAGD
jgi:superfamily I DNA/RNA helicase